MTHNFEIRFARSVGLAGLLEAPSNPFRWKGSGRISVDPKGIRIAVRRGPLTMFAPRARRIRFDQLTDVYREGATLRIEFGTPEGARVILPFWAKDRASAAEMVKLLPAPRSVELEDDTGGSSRGYRVDRPLVFSVLALFVVLFTGALVLRESPGFASGESPDFSSGNDAEHVQSDIGSQTFPSTTALETGPATEAPPAATISARAPSSSGSRGPTYSTEDLSRFESSAASDAAAAAAVQPIQTVPRQYGDLEAEINLLHQYCLEMVDRPEPTRMRDLERRWWNVIVRLYNSGYPPDEQRRGMYLGLARSWRNYLAGTGDARVEIEFAMRLMARSRGTEY